MNNSCLSFEDFFYKYKEREIITVDGAYHTQTNTTSGSLIFEKDYNLPIKVTARMDKGAIPQEAEFEVDLEVVKYSQQCCFTSKVLILCDC